MCKDYLSGGHIHIKSFMSSEVIPIWSLKRQATTLVTWNVSQICLEWREVRKVYIVVFFCGNNYEVFLGRTIRPLLTETNLKKAAWEPRSNIFIYVLAKNFWLPLVVHFPISTDLMDLVIFSNASKFRSIRNVDRTFSFLECYEGNSWTFWRWWGSTRFEDPVGAGEGGSVN